jgi:hypothetical protein
VRKEYLLASVMYASPAAARAASLEEINQQAKQDTDETGLLCVKDAGETSDLVGRIPVVVFFETPRGPIVEGKGLRSKFFPLSICDLVDLLQAIGTEQ